MKRGLKARSHNAKPGVKGSSRAFPDEEGTERPYQAGQDNPLSCSRAFPDEEGTERRRSPHATPAPKIVPEPSPMKRGLKG